MVVTSVLPKTARLRSSQDFSRTVRLGVRVARPTVVVYVASNRAGLGPHAGFVVSKAVGNAVTRNRVKRRLRNLAAAALGETLGGLDVVVRALPAAATDPDAMTRDLWSAWAKAVGRFHEREHRTADGRGATLRPIPQSAHAVHHS
jgi:ribonuclease P protein component